MINIFHVGNNYKIQQLLYFNHILLSQNADARPKGKQAAPAQEASQLQDLATQVQAGVNNVTTVLQGNLPNSKDVVNTINENAQRLSDRVKETVTKLKAEVGHRRAYY